MISIIVALPAIGASALAIWIATARILPVDPLSVWALGLGVSLALWQWVDRVMGVPRRAVVAWVVTAVVVVWAVANRVASIPTGPFAPGELLFGAVMLVAVMMVRDTHWRRAVGAISRELHDDVSRADRINRWVLVIVAVAFRAYIMFRIPVLVNGDSGVYLAASITLAESGSLAPLDAMYPPGYMLFLAATRWALGPDFLATVAIQHALGVITVLMTYAMARSALPPLLALIPALCTAINGYLLIIEHAIYTEALFMPLITTSGWLVINFIITNQQNRAMQAGFILACASLTRIVVQPFTFLIFFLTLFSQGWPTQQRIANCSLFICTFMITLVPCIMYNGFNENYFGIVKNAAPSVLPRLWEEEATYTWANQSHPDPSLRKTLQILQEARDKNLSYWQAWTLVRQEFPPQDASNLVIAGMVDVVLRHPVIFLDRTWYRWQRMWRGGFAQERIHDMYGDQDRLGIKTPIFALRDNGGDVMELAGNQADAMTRLMRLEDLSPSLTFVLTVLGIGGALVSRRMLVRLVPIGLGLGLLLIAVLLNADRARYRHPAEPFLLITYALGVQAIGDAARWGWRYVRPRRTVLPEIARS